jgi:uncharacterized iron-regulated membrane protein
MSTLHRDKSNPSVGEDARKGGAGSATHYRTVWRWHFFGGLFVAPVLLVLAVTGAIYLFDREIEGWWNRDILTVRVGAAPLALADQEAAVRVAYPSATINRVRLPRMPDQASRWLVTLPEGQSSEIFLDPYTGHVTGVADPDLQPMAIVRDLHGTLLAGDAGSYLVELTACWTMVMLATGIYLWWPRTWKARGTIVPRVQAGGRRLWRDLHAIPSIINALLVIFLILTGLPWSAFWGPQFAQLGQAIPFIAPSPNFGDHRAHITAMLAEPADGKDRAAHNHADHAGETPRETENLPWVIVQTLRPSSAGPVAIGIAEMEALLPLLERDRFGGGGSISFPKKPGDIFTISYVPDQAEGQRTIYIDPKDGRVIENIGWDRYSVVGKVTEWGVLTHMGRQYGLWNQIIGLVVCLCLVGTVSAGIVLWWRRRPQGTWAAPQVTPSDRMPSALKATIAAMAVLFPLVGASLVLVYVAERFRRTFLRRA